MRAEPVGGAGSGGQDSEGERGMGAGIRILAAFLAALAAAAGVAAQLRQDYYAAVCPDLESIVRDAVSKKVQAQPVAVGATIRLFFHDCFVEVRPVPPPLHRLQQRDFSFPSPKILVRGSERPREPGRRRRMCA